MDIITYESRQFSEYHLERRLKVLPQAMLAGVGAGASLSHVAHEGFGLRKKLEDKIRKEHPKWTDEQVKNEVHKIEIKRMKIAAGAGAALGGSIIMGYKIKNKNK